MSRAPKPKLMDLLAPGCTAIRREATWREIEIRSTGDLVRIVECYHLGSYQYRGQEDRPDWRLLPKLTREGGPADPPALGPVETWTQKERHILSEFRNRAPRYEATRDLTKVGELELAVWAQHHGTPTRLLDWTLNPLAALYFAVEDEQDSYNGVVWAIHGHREIGGTAPDDHLPSFKCGVRFVMPPRFFHRSAVQASILAVWGNPRRPFDEIVAGQSDLWKIIIPKDKRDCLRWSLHCLGIDRETLFPDMDGLGRHQSWKHRRIHQQTYRERCIPLSDKMLDDT
jgi:hypothetical protein